MSAPWTSSCPHPGPRHGLHPLTTIVTILIQLLIEITGSINGLFVDGWKSYEFEGPLLMWILKLQLVVASSRHGRIYIIIPPFLVSLITNFDVQKNICVRYYGPMIGVI